MKRSAFIFFFMFFMTCYIHAQVNYCNEILLEARNALRNDSIEKALQKLKDAEFCDYRNELLKERQSLLTDIFLAIEKQKRSAERG